MSIRRKIHKKDPLKTTKINWGNLSNIFTCDIKEVTAYYINEDYYYTNVF